MTTFLARSRTIAGPGFNRWLVPPAALCIHLCIGQAYAFSVFNLPLTRLLGISQSAPGDWKLTDVGWIFSIAIVFSARPPQSLAAGWKKADRGAPCSRPACSLDWVSWSRRWASICINCGWYSWAMGCWADAGWDWGYISPVSTLIKWFPDRPGMATGMAIMGFGGGALIASPLSVRLMQKFSTPQHVGIAEAFLVLGAGYFVFMMIGAALVRVPGPDFKPAGMAAVAPPETRQHARCVCVRRSEDPAVLAAVGCAVHERLGRHRGIGSGLGDEPGNLPRTGYGRGSGWLCWAPQPVQYGWALPFWASTSDVIGRRNTYFCFFLLGIVVVCAGAPDRRHGQCAPVRRLLGSDHQYVWRWLRHDTGVLARYIWYALCGRHPRHAADGLVGCRRARPPYWSITSANTRSTTASPKRRPITRRCIFWRGLLWWDCSAISW